MNIKHINQIIDQEIKFSRETPLVDTLDENFVDGFIKGLTQARFLLNAAEQTEAYGVAPTATTNIKEGEMLWMTPEGKVISVSTSGYVDVVPEPIPNLNKILEKYDGIIITGARGSGKTTTALKVIEYIIGGGKSQSNIFIFPTTHDAKATLTSSEYEGLLSGKYSFTNANVSWKNGSTACVVSSERPDRLRGPQSGVLWFEEIGNFAKSRPDTVINGGVRDVHHNILDLAAFCHRLDYHKVIITGTEYKEAIRGTWLEKLNLYTYNLNLPI